MKEKMTFEQAGERLDEILSALSDENTPLAQCLSLYAEAAELIAHSEKLIEKAQITVEEIDAKLAAAGQDA